MDTQPKTKFEKASRELGDNRTQQEFYTIYAAILKPGRQRERALDLARVRYLDSN